MLAAYNDRGAAFAEAGHYDEAITDYTRALEIEPKHAEFYNNRGAAYREKGQYDQALADFNRALEINPKYGNAYYNRAAVFCCKKDYEHGWADIRKAESLGIKSTRHFSTPFVRLRMWKDKLTLQSP